MTRPWTFAGSPGAGGFGEVSITLLEGSCFCISDSRGDILPDRSHGLFVRDTRLLSRWELTVDGTRPVPLTVQHSDPFAGAFLGWVPHDPAAAGDPLLVVRRRYVGDGMREDLAIHNGGPRPVTCAVEIRADADFADLFEVKDGRVHQRQDTRVSTDGQALRISRPRGGREYSVVVRADQDAETESDGVRWRVTIPAHGVWTACVEVVASFGEKLLPLRHPRGQPVQHAAPAQSLRRWRRSSPVLRTADPDLATVLRRSVEDLGTLRIFNPENPDRAVVAAGAPWFMALFGRDSLLTSWMLLAVDAGLAVGTLQTLAGHQGRSVDRDSEEEPGRILHEMRFGPAVELALGGGSVYYGTADATPLFVMLLGELRRWGMHDEEVASLLPHADRAMDWIEHFGDADGDGFVEYVRKTERGLVNQGWKDSWDGINFADGTIAEPPIALAEVQSYTYGAYQARAELAEAAGDVASAREWTQKADRIKQAFNERFWLEDQGWFAVGLDRHKRPIDSLTSNIGHCLWTGIADEDKAARVADHLLSDEMFTGWGIRTLAASMGAYNPLSYHNGSVWPHDNAICVSGLMRYGFVEHAQRVAEGILDAAAHFGHRLPELFCGFSRVDFPEPVPYPTSCSPQAWAAAAPLQLLRGLLRLEPHRSEGRLSCAPAVPDRYLPLRVHNLRLGDLHVNIDVRRDGWELTGTDRNGVELLRLP